MDIGNRKDEIPDHSSTRLEIVDFCDMIRFEQMMHDWARGTGLATVVMDRDGKYICRHQNFTEFCHGLTRKSPEGLRRCIECDKQGKGIYHCHAGLVDFATPITLEDGTVLGNIVGGQVLPAKPDEEHFRRTARELGIDEDDYIRALHQVNVRSKEEIEASAHLLGNVINLFVRASYAAYRNEESLSERSRIISSLSKIYSCDYYVDLDRDTYTELDATVPLHSFTGYNGVASKMFRKSAPVFIEKVFVEDYIRFTDPATLRERMGKRQSISFEFVSYDFGWRRASIIAASYHENGVLSHVIFAIQPIQEEKENDIQIQRQLKDAAEEANQANRAKSEFLSRMSHDMRTPLNGIIGMTHLSMERNTSVQIGDYLTKIDTSSKFLLGLINDILDLTKAESNSIKLHPEPYLEAEFSSYMDAVIMPLIREKNQAMDFHMYLPENAVPLLDKLRINQIFFNILSNAVKFTSEGGNIKFITTGKMQGNEKILMHFEISDTGIGISKEFLKCIFDPFTQESRDDVSSRRGSGLGMAITKHLVDLMGGTISIDSEPGRGSTFTIEMLSNVVFACAVNKKMGTGKMEIVDRGKNFVGKHILLCEDHPINQEITKALLQGKSMLVDLAEDGLKGLHLFNSSPAGYYDAILMDIRMPVMNGYETVESIRKLNRADAGTIPIIALTADAFSDDVEKCLRAGMNGHVAKPIDPVILYETLQRYIK